MKTSKKLHLKMMGAIAPITTSTAIFLGVVSGIAFAQNVPIEEQVNAVVSHLVGVMDTSAQAATNPKAASVRMTTCKVQLVNNMPQSASSVYLYQEQALSENLNRPYRQRLLQIQPSADGKTVESKAYKLENSKIVVGLCNKPEQQRVVASSNLGKAVCSVFLKPSEKGYIGETPSQGCPANVRGAVRITNTILLHSQGMDTWDRGFDAKGNQVWGAQAQSYQFRWVERRQQD